MSEVRGVGETFSPERLDRIEDTGKLAIVDASARVGDSTTRIRFVVATDEGTWGVLWLTPRANEQSTSPFAAQVVTNVTFDTTESRARVAFVDTPVADRVRVESDRPNSYRETDTPESVAHLDVALDPEGDELGVTAVIDDEERLVHRARFPPEDRIVDEVRYETDDPAQAIVEVSEVGQIDSLSAFTTRSGGERTIGTGVSTIQYLGVTMDPSGDEVIVTKPVDGETIETHRERYHS